MRDGSEDGMQYFDGEIEKNIRSGLIDMEAGLSYSTNPGNLRLQLADLLEEGSGIPSGQSRPPRASKAREPRHRSRARNTPLGVELQCLSPAVLSGGFARSPSFLQETADC